jgi:hypothetical protein
VLRYCYSLSQEAVVKKLLYACKCRYYTLVNTLLVHRGRLEYMA